MKKLATLAAILALSAPVFANDHGKTAAPETAAPATQEAAPVKKAAKKAKKVKKDEHKEGAEAPKTEEATH